MANTLLSNIVAPSSLVQISATQTLSNKTLASAILTGSLTAGGSTGTNGQVLTSTGTGLAWATVTQSGSYSLPTASTTVLGGVKVDGSTITINNGVISATQPSLATVATTGSYTDLINKPSLATVATSGSYTDLTNKPTIPTVPTVVSAFTNDAGYATTTSVTSSINTAINNLINSAPSTLDTLGEIAAQLAADESAAAALTTTVAGKVSLTGSYANPSWITSLAYSKLTGAPSTYVNLGNTKVDLGTTVSSIDSLTLTSPTISNPTISGSVTAGGNTGTAGQVLTSTGTGVQWSNPTGGSSTSSSDASLVVIGRSLNITAKLTGFLSVCFGYDDITTRTPMATVITRNATVYAYGS